MYIPDWLSYFISAGFGLIAGSFLNVLIHRIPLGKSIIKPGSHCPKCGKPLRWRDNIPLLGFLLLRGRCHSCDARISIRYPAVELLTALVFVAMWTRFGWGALLVLRDWPLGALLVAITFIDLDHRLIPDQLSIPGIVLGLATSWADPGVGLWSSLAGAALGFGFFYAFAWIYEKATGRQGLGGGDIKLLAMIGAFAGPLGVFFTVMMSSITGTVIGLVWALVARRRSLMKFAIPFGPFLAAAGLYYYLLGDVWFRSMIRM
ncbi:MAG: hypothetical protein A2583_09645 [Bdellovibrionales bacterium RIFOXYD1_FULL_53_11]|nr:MAG: hypothetical protein A2583_09645 [Bdellovibrionales bacterium RIFOXYD1_FULL_53_11]